MGKKLTAGQVEEINRSGAAVRPQKKRSVGRQNGNQKATLKGEQKTAGKVQPRTDVNLSHNTVAGDRCRINQRKTTTWKG